MNPIFNPIESKETLGGGGNTCSSLICNILKEFGPQAKTTFSQGPIIVRQFLNIHTLNIVVKQRGGNNWYFKSTKYINHNNKQ